MGEGAGTGRRCARHNLAAAADGSCVVCRRDEAGAADRAGGWNPWQVISAVVLIAVGAMTWKQLRSCGSESDPRPTTEAVADTPQPQPPAGPAASELGGGGPAERDTSRGTIEERIRRGEVKWAEPPGLEAKRAAWEAQRLEREAEMRKKMEQRRTPEEALEEWRRRRQ